MGCLCALSGAYKEWWLQTASHCRIAWPASSLPGANNLIATGLCFVSPMFCWCACIQEMKMQWVLLKRVLLKRAS